MSCSGDFFSPCPLHLKSTDSQKSRHMHTSSHRTCPWWQSWGPSIRVKAFQRLRALFSTPAPTQKCKTPWPRDTWAKTVSDEYELKNSVPLQVSWTLLIIQSTACDWLWWGFYHGTLYQTQRDDLWASNTNPISHSYPGLVPLNGILTFPESFRRKWLSVST